MTRVLTVCLAGLASALALGGAAGCVGRLISEGAGVALGARGKVVDVTAVSSQSLRAYRGIRFEPITVSRGLKTPPRIAALVRSEFSRRVAEEFDFDSQREPTLVLHAEIIHYESGGAVDTAIGPLEEIILRARLIDASGGNLLAEANLIGRSKATTSSGAENLAEGAGRALEKWLKEGGAPRKNKDDEHSRRNK